MWLPMNDISANLYYDQRIIVSSLIKEPITWQISKVENIHPFGINKLTLSQTKFNPNTDYVNLDTGEMYADYYKNSVPLNEDTTLLSINSPSKTIKIGGSKRRITSSINTSESSWRFVIDGNNAGSLLDIDYGPNYIDIKFTGDESYLGKTLTVLCNKAVLSLEIVAL